MAESLYVESWCRKHRVTQEERQSFRLAYMLVAVAACERAQDMKIVNWSVKAEMELNRIRKENRHS